MTDDTDGAWLAYYEDWSDFVVFASELAYLRYAVEHSMSAKRIKYGERLRNG